VKDGFLFCHNSVHRAVLCTDTLFDSEQANYKLVRRGPSESMVAEHPKEAAAVKLYIKDPGIFVDFIPHLRLS